MEQGSNLRQEQKQKQVTVLTQQIEFAHLLETPDAGMEERVKQEVDANDALEFDNDPDSNDNNNDFDSNSESESIKEKDEIVDMYMTDDDGNPVANGTGGSTEEKYRPEQSQDDTKLDQLIEQMNELRLTEKEKRILGYIIGSLEDNGLLFTPVSKILYELNVEQNVEATEDDVLDMLETLQEFDPAGVGAHNYQESLLLQAKRLSAPTEEKQTVKKHIISIISNQYDDFLHQRWDAIKQRLKINDDMRNTIIRTIKTLSPCPYSTDGNYADHGNAQVVPDFIIRENEEGEVYFELKDNHIPRIRLSETIQEAVKLQEENKKKMSVSEKQWLNNMKQKIESANNFIEMIKQRKLTLYKTMKAIFDIQKDYFVECDESKLKPMILEDVAKRTGLDISTVSRVSNIRYVENLQGEIFPLKYFYSGGYTNDNGEEKSKQEIIHALRDIIDNENKQKPYTDEELVIKIKERGFNLARRTIAKHRAQLGFPTASIRKNSYSK